VAANAEEFIITLTQKVSGADLGGVIGQLSAKLGDGQSKVSAFSVAVQGLGSKLDAGGKGLGGFGDAATQVGGKLASMGGPLGSVQSGLAKLGPYGLAAAAALAVLTVAITATVGALVAMAAAAIQVVQTRAALLATFSALGGGAAQGRATLEMVERLGEKLPFTTDKIAEWAKSLQSAGLQGKSLEHAVKAVAAATALMGDSGGVAAQNLIEKLAEGGKGADAMLKQIQQGAGRSNKLLAEMGLMSRDVAKALGKTPEEMKKAKVSADDMRKAIETALRAKGGGALEQLGSTFPVIIAKAKEGLLSLFDKLGPSVAPFMAAIKSLFGEFSKGGNAIKILKPIVTDVFSTLFSWATRAVTFIHDGFQQLEIVGLKVAIALAPIINAIRRFAASENFIRGLKVAFVLLGAAIAIAVLPLIVLGAAVVIVIGLFVALVAGAIYLAGVIGGAVTGAFARIKAAVASFKLPNLAAAARNMVASFIAAISAGIGSVVQAMASMGSAAKGALFRALGIASPSKVAVEAAANVTTSFADTVDAGKPKTQAAFAGMVKDAGKQAPGKSGGGSGKGGALERLASAVEKLAASMGDSPGFKELLTLALDEAAREAEGT